MTNPKIAICYYGITRCINHTHTLLEKNIQQEAKKIGETKVFAHFFDQKIIDNPRSQEKGNNQTDNWELLRPDYISIEDDMPDDLIKNIDMVKTKTSDHYQNEWRSVTNIMRQMVSIDRVTRMVEESGWEPDYILFIRPDILWHEPITSYLKEAQKGISLPNWQGYNGYNDRMAIAVGKEYHQIWGQRLCSLKPYLDTHDTLIPERFLKWHLKNKKTVPNKINIKGQRIRMNGERVKEDYTPDDVYEAKFIQDRKKAKINTILRRIRNTLKRIGIPEKYLSIRSKRK